MSRWSGWFPGRGDVVRARTRSSGGQPAFVVSPAAYCAKTDFALVCPIAGSQTGYPFEVAVRPQLEGCAVILADRVVSLNVRAWDLARVCTLGNDVTLDVLAKLATLVSLPDDKV